MLIEKPTVTMAFMKAGLNNNYEFFSKEVLYKAWKSKVGQIVVDKRILEVNLDEQQDGIWIKFTEE